MNHGAARMWALLLLVIVAAYGGWSTYRHFGGESSTPSVYIGEAVPDTETKRTTPTPPSGYKDLRFFERNGDEFKFKEMDGKLWVASFFFTACPGECKILNNEIAKLQHEYRDRDVTFVSITCDPENDTLEALRKYANFYSADPKKWLFVRGDADYTTFLGLTRFKVNVVKKSHSDRMILIRHDGVIEDYYSGKQPSDMLKLRKALDRLLAADSKVDSSADGSGLNDGSGT